MRKIANILTKNLFNNKIFYNVVDSKDKLIEGLPVLCVGLELTKKNYPNFNLLKMDVSDYVYWTYGPREKRNVYENRMKEFIRKSIDMFRDGIKYEYVNIIVGGTCCETFLKINELIFKGGKRTISFVFNGMIYIYDNICTVYGISIREISYIGENEKVFLSNVYNNTTVIVNKNSIPLDVRVLFNGYDYLIPCLYSDNNKC